MDDAYHVTLTGQPQGAAAPFAPGERFDLQPAPATYAPGADAELARLFPEGLTRHGATYMTVTPAEPSAWPSWNAELFFEAVRRGEFPDRPSRMQSVFAFGSIEDAHAFVGGYRAGQQCAVYRVRGEVVHRANMSLLQASALPGVVAFDLARSYWRGEQGARSALFELLLRPPVEVVDLVGAVVK